MRDITFVLETINDSCFHNYIFLYETLKKHFNVLFCVNKNRDNFGSFNTSYEQDDFVYFENKDQAESLLWKSKCKYLVLDGFKSQLNEELVTSIHLQGNPRFDHVIQLAGANMNDFRYVDARVKGVFLANDLHYQILKDDNQIQTSSPGIGKKIEEARAEVHYVGSVYYNKIPNVYTSKIAKRKDFYKKYKLDSSKKIALWLPSKEDECYTEELQHEFSKKKGWQLITKLHPWSHKAGVKFDMTTIEPEDSYWANIFADLFITRSSTILPELAYYKTPVACFDYSAPPIYLAIKFGGALFVNIQQMVGLIDDLVEKSTKTNYNAVLDYIDTRPFNTTASKITNVFKGLLND